MTGPLRLRRAAHLRRKGKGVEAALLLREGIEAADKIDPRLLIQLGHLAKNPEKYREAADRDPDNRAALVFSAIAAYRGGDFQEAKNLAREGIIRSPGHITLHALLALVDFHDHGDATLAPLAHALKGAIDPVRALALLEIEKAIITHDPEDTGARDEEPPLAGPVGWLLERLDDIAALLHWLLNHVINLVVNITNSRRRKAWRAVIQGMLFESFGQDEEAARWYRQALTDDPLNRDALDYLVANALANNDPYRADPLLKRLERLEEEGKQDGRIIRLRADILFLRGDYRQAVEKYTWIAKEEPLDYFPLYRLALSHLRLGDKEAAFQAFAETLGRVNPGLLFSRIGTLEKKYQSATTIS